MMRHAFLSLLIASALSLNAAEKRFERSGDKFAITLTTDWKEVNATNAPYAKQVLTADDDMTSRAYQLASPTNFAAVVFIEIDNSLRVSESDMARLQVDALRKAFLSTALEIQGLQLLDSSYETNRPAVRFSATCDFARTGKARMVAGWYFTDKGSYSVTCVAPVEHFKTVSATFSKALDTFHIDPSLAYRPRANAAVTAEDLAKAERAGRVRIHVGFIFGAVGVILFIIRHLAARVTTDEI